jgi:chromosome segregation ATPase
MPVATPPVDPAASSLREELAELRRVLDDAHSALAQRDREIRAAEDELRVLRAEIATLRTGKAP